MNLFLDTNILLSFYHYSSDDLEELKKLIVLLEQGKVTLFMPGQVIQEFRRNPEGKIADALKRLKEQKLPSQFPQFCKDYAEYTEMRAAQVTYAKQYSAMMEKLEDDIDKKSLKADVITAQLFKRSQVIPCDELVPVAEVRYKRGNPPGKENSIGDALNWEALLKAVPEKAPIHFISDDKDYLSPLGEDAFNGFLQGEWGEKKKGDVLFYKRLSAFFQEHFPDIKFAAQLEVDLLIEELASGTKFATTHAVVAKLSKYEELEPAQVNAIIEAALTNSQVYWIIDDDDVHQFLTELSEKYGDKIAPELAKKLEHVLSSKEAPEPPEESWETSF